MMHVSGDGLAAPIDIDTGTTTAVSTHVSTLWFHDGLVVKRKKPVRFAFLDLTTAARREENCRREVALNRRLSPDVYLGVVEVRDEDDGTADHAVLMRALPGERRLSRRLDDAGGVDECLRAVARRLTRLHAAPTSRPVDVAPATPERVLARWAADLRELREVAASTGARAIGEQAEAVEALAVAYLAGRRALLESRISDGRVVDGHGDLLADDIFCLDDGPRILDCLEFDDSLRVGDALADVAFLAMDLERRGVPALAASFVATYRELAADAAPDSLLHHYVAARALVRGKVAMFREAAGGPPGDEQPAPLLALCRSHLERAVPLLVVVGGLPATGKSTVATALADRERMARLATDEVRKDLVGLGHQRGPGDAVDRGIYRAEVTERTYAEVLRRAGQALAMGESAVLDGSFTDGRHREAARALAREARARLVELCCVAPAAVAEARLRARRIATDQPSDATVTVARALAARFDPWPRAATIDTGGPVEGAVAEACRLAAAARARLPEG